VNKASSFPSAHVFPGGALSSTHDGAIPPPTSPTHHEDGPAYRLAAVRETFEECGILLATSKNTGQLFTDISDTEREEGRRAVHSGKLRFPELLEKWGAVPDTQRLIPFTRWITPPSMPKRFSTQMYLYFLPPSSASPSSSPGPDELVIPAPTHDGGIEHTAARFLPPATWLHLARTNQVLLFPPQFFLLHLLSRYLCATTTTTTTPPSPTLERTALLSFLRAPRSYAGTAEPTWADACISPITLGKGAYGDASQDSVGGVVDRHTAVLDLSSAGAEVEALGAGRKGVREWVVTAKFRREGPRDVAVRRRGDVLRGEEVGRGKL